jgi:hypothetical protein
MGTVLGSARPHQSGWMDGWMDGSSRPRSMATRTTHDDDDETDDDDDDDDDDDETDVDETDVETAWTRTGDDEF